MRVDAVLQAEALGEIEQVRRTAAAERENRTEADVERQAPDAGGHNAIALAPRYGMLSVLRRRREIETEEVIAGLLRVRVRVRHARPPALRIRTVEGQENAVIPVTLSFRIGDQHVAESRHDRRATEAARRKPRKAAIAAHVVVADRDDPRRAGRLAVPEIH